MSSPSVSSSGIVFSGFSLPPVVHVPSLMDNRVVHKNDNQSNTGEDKEGQGPLYHHMAGNETKECSWPQDTNVFHGQEESCRRNSKEYFLTSWWTICDLLVIFTMTQSQSYRQSIYRTRPGREKRISFDTTVLVEEK